MMDQNEKNSRENTKPSRIERKLAWGLIIAGAAIMILYALYSLIISFEKITLEKLGAFLLLAGFLVLVISVLVERVRERGSDKYRSINK
jgi:uncharacterized membrane protein YhaH (DUF805 family)